CYNNGQKKEQCAVYEVVKVQDVLKNPKSSPVFPPNRPILCKTLKYTQWYENGEKQSEGEFDFDSRLKEGLWEYWYPNGYASRKGKYKKGVRDGPWKEWYANRLKRSFGSYTNGFKTGKWHYLYETGVRCMEGFYVNGKKSGEWLYWNPGGSRKIMCNTR